MGELFISFHLVAWSFFHNWKDKNWPSGHACRQEKDNIQIQRVWVSVRCTLWRWVLLPVILTERPGKCRVHKHMTFAFSLSCYYIVWFRWRRSSCMWHGQPVQFCNFLQEGTESQEEIEGAQCDKKGYERNYRVCCSGGAKITKEAVGGEGNNNSRNYERRPKVPWLNYNKCLWY